MNVKATIVVSDPCLARLLTAVATGDRNAFQQLYNQTSGKLYGTICRILTRSDLAADALQEAYLRIWQRAGTFDPTKGTALAWMTTIARNRAIDETRRAKQLLLEDMGDEFDPPAEDCDPFGSLERSEKLKAIVQGLSQLKPEKRELILLAYYRGASREALSKRFGIPTPTIKTHLRRTLAQLKICLPA